MPVNLYYTQKVREFQQKKIKYSKNSAIIYLRRTKHQCPYCGSDSITVELRITMAYDKRIGKETSAKEIFPYPDITHKGNRD